MTVEGNGSQGPQVKPLIKDSAYYASEAEHVVNRTIKNAGRISSENFGANMQHAQVYATLALRHTLIELFGEMVDAEE